MKLQNLTVIFSIIVIPITLILSAYIGIQIDTAFVQQRYSSKLIDATHDAVAAFELNTISNKYSTNADSLRRDIKAAITTFSTSLASGFGGSGASSSSIMPYIPAIVFTLYDGYYIYSPIKYTYIEDGQTKTGYQHTLKPYIYYTGRYKNGEKNDVTVNYSLDNYITIYGYVNGEYISKSGYLIDTSRVKANAKGEVISLKINGNYYPIEEETLTQWNEKGDKVETKSTSAKEYYQEAYDFTTWLEKTTTGKTILETVTPANAVNSEGKTYKKYFEEDINDESSFYVDYYLQFANDNTQILNISSKNDPEDTQSAFVQHKRAMMKLSIQDNLNNAIAVYDENSTSMGVGSKFQMPILTEEDWDKILTNVNMISFMQGLQAGTKVYNDYAIVTSTQNKQYVNPNSIYFVADGDDTYHRINCSALSSNNIVGYKSIDFKRLSNTAGTGYYYKHSEYSCYTCIVNTLNDDLDVSKLSDNLQKAYYMALARERYDLDKITKMLLYTK